MRFRYSYVIRVWGLAWLHCSRQGPWCSHTNGFTGAVGAACGRPSLLVRAPQSCPNSCMSSCIPTRRDAESSVPYKARLIDCGILSSELDGLGTAIRPNLCMASRIPTRRADTRSAPTGDVCSGRNPQRNLPNHSLFRKQNNQGFALCPFAYKSTKNKFFRIFPRTLFLKKGSWSAGGPVPGGHTAICLVC